ncbi:glycosyltransferase [Xylophilus sp. GW821-FHT01B05]
MQISYLLRHPGIMPGGPGRIMPAFQEHSGLCDRGVKRRKDLGNGLTVSVVSHGHDAWLPGLLQQLALTGAGQIVQVILTHNLPPANGTLQDAGWPFQLTQIVNTAPKGFGPNHNEAFKQAQAPLFCVLNPDIRLPDPSLWPALCEAASLPGVGCAYPRLLDTDGTQQDSERAAVTPWALFRRRVLRRADARVDWASAALWVLPSSVYRQLGGFDERYFMYCEDVDFCLRLQLGGWRLLHVPAEAVHEAQRASHRQRSHLVWHLQSLWRLWTRPVLWRYLWTRASRRSPT